MKFLSKIIAAIIFSLSGLTVNAQSDNCNTATPLTLTNDTVCVSGTTVNSTSSNFLHGTCNPNNVVNEVWYTYVTGGANNDFTVTPNGLQNTEIVIYTGGCPGAGGTLINCVTATGTNTLNTSWAFPVGTQVWIGIASTDSTQGGFDFCINSYPPPAGGGNTCSGAIPLCDKDPFTVNDMSSLSSSGYTLNCGGTVQQDIWFTFTVTQAGTIEWTGDPLTATEYDWELLDISGGCPGTSVRCNYNYTFSAGDDFGMGMGQPTAEYEGAYNATAGQTFALVIDNYDGDGNGFNFTWGGSALISTDVNFSISPTNAQCADSVVVSISDSTTGVPTYNFGDGSATYTGNNPPDHTYNTPGTYAITASISGACPSSHTEYVQLFGPLSATTDSVRETCFGDCDGEASIQVSGGSGSYSYSWSGGQTGPSITNQCPGNYTITATDDSCASTITRTINIPAGSQVTAAITDSNATCNGVCDGSITITATGGDGPYQYSNDGGTSFQASNTFGSLCANTYNISVIDTNNCRFDTTITITEPAPITFDTNTVAATCGQSNGQIDIFSTQGGTPPYQFSNDGGTTFQSDSTFTNYPGGTYNMVIEDGNGCQVTFNITVNDLPGPEITGVTISDPLCNGSSDGTITINTNGGTSPLQFSNDSGATFQGSNSFTGLASGTYNLVVQDANGCSDDTVVTLTDPPALSFTTTLTQPTCGATDGSISISASGGTSPYQYSIDNGATYQSNNTFNNLGSGTYTIVVQDTNGCTASKIDTLSSNGGPVIDSIITTDPLCNGSSDGGIIIYISGGTTPINYSIDNGTTFQGSNTFTGLTSGIYNIVVSDTNGCTASTTTTLTDPPLLVLDSVSTVDADCFGASTGSLTIFSSGGTGNHQYSNDGGASFQASNSFTGITAGTYNIVVEDSNTCQVTTTATINEPTNLTIPLTVTNDSCYQGCTGQIIAAPQGGTSPYSYSWSNGTSGAVANNLCAGSYSLTVTDANGCTEDTTVTITEPNAFNIQTSTVNANCGQPDGSASVDNVSGGTSPYSYQWDAAAGSVTTSTASNLAPGNYCVTILDANNCDTIVCVTVGNNPGITASISGQTNISCNGNCDGTATASGSGGAGAYSYQWSASAGNQTTVTATNLCAGQHYCVLTDPNGCTDTAFVTLTQPNKLQMLSVSADDTICINGSTTITSQATGGTSPYTYYWDKGLGTGQTQNVSPASQTTYSVYVQDNNGCSSDTLSVTIDLYPSLDVTASADVEICPGESTTLTANASGGMGSPYNYTWNNGGGSGSSVQVSPSSTTQYIVTAADGCTTPSTSDTVTVTVNPTPDVNFISDKEAGCGPLTVEFVNTTDPNMVGNSCSWNFNDGTSITGCDTVSHTFTEAGSYDITLTVTSPKGCEGSTTVNNMITVYPDPIASFEYAPESTTLINPEIEFFNTSSGGIGSQWNFGDGDSSIITNPVHTYRDSGTYLVTLVSTNQYSCTDTVRKEVRIDPEFILYVPNAFSPDGNGENDIFLPQGINIDPDNYTLYIFNRWGEVIFESHHPDKGWNGVPEGGTEVSPTGVYTWMIKTKNQYGDVVTKYGKLTLIK